MIPLIGKAPPHTAVGFPVSGCENCMGRGCHQCTPTNDLVQRLRMIAGGIYDEAAEEIERLTRERSEWESLAAALQTQSANFSAENMRLRAALEDMWAALCDIDQPGADLCTVTYMQRRAREAMSTVSTPRGAAETDEGTPSRETQL